MNNEFKKARDLMALELVSDDKLMKRYTADVAMLLFGHQTRALHLQDREVRNKMAEDILTLIFDLNAWRKKAKIEKGASVPEPDYGPEAPQEEVEITPSE
jgi:hypothetical protein